MSDKKSLKKLYECEPNQWYKTEDGLIFFFQHLDGMYSYCKDPTGQILHLAAFTPVYETTKPL